MEHELHYYDIEQGSGCRGRIVGGVIGLLVCLLISLCTCSCSRKVTSTEKYDYLGVDKERLSVLIDSVDNQLVRLSSIEKEKEKKDSVYTHHTDSTYVYVKGDSTIITRYIHDIEYRESKGSEKTIESLRDSVNTFKAQSSAYEEKLDSVRNSVQKEVVTKMYVPVWMKIGFTTILLLFLLIVLYTLKVRK